MKNKKLKVGIIGCGTIGRAIAVACQKDLVDSIDIVALFDIDKDKALTLAKTLKRKVPLLTSPELIKKSGLIVEAASASISAEILKSCIAAKRDCLIMSVGGLVGKEKLLDRAAAAGVRVYIPSGAVSGIDGLKSAMAGGITSVTLTTRKPPKGLVGAPYLKENHIDVSKIDGETVIFEGSAKEAVKGFPQNVNVSAVLSLAGIGARRTRVRIVTSPGYTVNVHEIEVIGASGRIMTRTENVPSSTNPKTSALAIFSAIATLRSAASSVRIGT
ncbi:MAG: aspartate dehydrogenase [Candidatus Omnitrophica bacterium]|nr:aspartate dehydrogenase [Candidatus Omnitrophota bacterium]